jgi:hypothetical protein
VAVFTTSGVGTGSVAVATGGFGTCDGDVITIPFSGWGFTIARVFFASPRKSKAYVTGFRLGNRSYWMAM